MTGELLGDAWLSADDFNARAAANAQIRGEVLTWFRRIVPWFAEHDLMVHQGLPVYHGTHWAGSETWMLATPVDATGTPAVERREGQAARLGMIWAPTPSAPPERLRALADPLPAGGAVPGIRKPTADLKIVRAPGWKRGLERANRELEDRRDWWEHRTLGIDAQRRRGEVNSSWMDRVRDA